MDTATGRLLGPDCRRFVTAGRATFTLLNPTTGRRFTYRVKARKPALFAVAYRHGSVYVPLGTISKNTFYPAGTANPTAAKGFTWLWHHLDNLPDTMELWHEGACGRCGRPLTDPDSIAAGYGPDCRERLDFNSLNPANAVHFDTIARRRA